MTANDKQMEPCRMADNLYHIGVRGGPCYLLETIDGIVLIDTAFPETVDLLLENFARIGKDPRDVRHIIHTHGHYDHVGATRALVAMSGAKTYIGVGDEDAVRGVNELIFANEMGVCYTDTFEPDVIVRDGDVLVFGDTSIRFVATPGHTAGTVSLFFDVSVQGKRYRAGLFGGAGLNSLTVEYLTRYGLPLSMRDTFLQSIDKVIDEPVDFHVGNHLSDNNFHEKRLHVGEAENPFLVGKTYRPFLEARRQQAIRAFAEDAEKS